MKEKVGIVGNKILTFVISVFAACLIVFSVFVLYDTVYVQNDAFSDNSELIKYKPVVIEDGETPLTQGTAMSALNDDYRAWLTIDDTPIDYPVMQGKDDLYYASHDAFGKSSLSGIIYLAAGNTRDFSDNYNLVYGHHIDNDAMFGSLDHFKEKGFFDTHKTGRLVTEDTVYDLHIFAAVDTDAYEQTVYMVGGDRDLEAVYNYIDGHKIQFESGAAVTGDKILVMSTCADGTTNGRLAVFAVMHENPDAIVNDGGDDLVEIGDDRTPLAFTDDPWTPKGAAYRAWALLNLICTILTVLILLPVLHIKAKYRREKYLKDFRENKYLLYNEEDKYLTEQENLEKELILDKVKERIEKDPDKDPEEEFRNVVNELYAGKKKRFVTGIILEAILSVFAIWFFIKTEDIRLPMILIDKWTLLHVIVLAFTYVVDIIFIRRIFEEKEVEEEEAEQADSES